MLDFLLRLAVVAGANFVGSAVVAATGANEECLVSASHQLALITSLPFVHTARRSYRLGVLVKCSDWREAVATLFPAEKFIKPSHLEEGEVVTRFP